jgi:hypothetical protein
MRWFGGFHASSIDAARESAKRVWARFDLREGRFYTSDGNPNTRPVSDASFNPLQRYFYEMYKPQ